MNGLPLYIYISVLGASFVLSLILTPLIRKLAIAYGRVAVPKDNRWHKKTTALLGGISIFFATLTVWVLATRFTDWDTYGRLYLPMMLCASAIFALGLADDIFNMDPQHKLAGQIIITSILMFFGFRLGWVDSKAVNLFLSILWVVGVTNAFNLLDNMDGLSAGIAFICGAFLFFWHFMEPQSLVSGGPILLISASYLGKRFGKEKGN